MPCGSEKKLYLNLLIELGLVFRRLKVKMPTLDKMVLEARSTASSLTKVRNGQKKN